MNVNKDSRSLFIRISSGAGNDDLMYNRHCFASNNTTYPLSIIFFLDSTYECSVCVSALSQ